MEPPIRSPVNYSQRFSLFLFRRRGFPIMGIPTPLSLHLGRAAGGEDALQIANLNSPSPANHQHALPLTFFFPPVASVYSCARELITIVCIPPSILLFANFYSPSRHRADGILKALCIFTILSARNQSPVQTRGIEDVKRDAGIKSRGVTPLSQQINIFKLLQSYYNQ